MNIKILKSLLKRYYLYNGEIFLSRHEHKKFGLSEWGMRLELRKLRRNGLLTVGKRYCGREKFTNLYKISEELLEFIKEQCKKVKISFDIVKFNNETSTQEAKRLLGVTSRHNGRDLHLGDGITYNTSMKILCFWKNEGKKHFNLFNGLKILYSLNTYQLIKELGN